MTGALALGFWNDRDHEDAIGYEASTSAALEQVVHKKKRRYGPMAINPAIKIQVVMRVCAASNCGPIGLRLRPHGSTSTLANPRHSAKMALKGGKDAILG